MNNNDMCVPCAQGLINIRAGAIIIKDGRFLMVRNDSCGYLYSVGGRLKFPETAEEAVIRETEEETGVRLEIDHLGFIQENYFRGDMPASYGKTVYEVAYYFYMKVPDDFEPVSHSYSSDNHPEYLVWADADTPLKMYPEFFRYALDPAEKGVRHIVNDERVRIGNVYSAVIDRPYGSAHPQYPDLIYPLNYGYIKGLYGGDGEEQDVYVLGIKEPLEEFTGKLIAVIHRRDDVEDKWVLAEEHADFSEEEIRQAVWFQEQYFDIEIQMDQNSAV